MLAFPFAIVQGQEAPGKWSEPRLLLQGPPKDNGTNPIVYTGPSNNTYLLYFGRPSDDPAGPYALYYARWVDGDWTQPVDVLITPDNSLPPTLAAVEDSSGYLHVIWNTNAVWYTRVAIQAADRPQSWQAPVAIYGDRLALEVAATIDANDLIHVVVTSRDRTVDYVPLYPDGTVGLPALVHQIADTEYYPYRVSLAVTRQGRLLVCWAEVSSGARGVWCSASENGGAKWDIPTMIASGHRGVRLVYFAQTDQVARIVWGGLGLGGRELQMSDDDGQTWSPPIDLTQGVPMAGYSGQVAAMDSSGDIHVLINPGDGKYVHARTENGVWLPNSPTGWQASDWIEMSVAEGNTLVVVYWTLGSTYTSHLVLKAPRVTPRPLMSPSDAQAQVSARSMASTPDVSPVSPTSTPVPRSTELLSLGQRAPGGISGTLSSVLFGVIPAVIVVLGVVVFRRRVRAL